MAQVIREDTGEHVGLLVDLYGPLPPGVAEWQFKAWWHPNGALRSQPAVPVMRGGRLTAPAPVECRIPVRSGQNGEVELVVPPDLLDFILSHTGFRPLPAERA